MTEDCTGVYRTHHYTSGSLSGCHLATLVLRLARRVTERQDSIPNGCVRDYESIGV